ncbi:MAG TPA: endonuclease III [Myxococcota bacterium]|nr:endonuclease III [Myxococcota bacterium]HPC91166.1 endonuclease III [Myxococcota bacterium]
MKTRALKVVDILANWYPDATTSPLNWNTPLELLIATILAAQSRDVLINQVMPVLMGTLPTAQAIADAPIEQLEELVRQTGFYKNKAKALKKCCQQLIEFHGGEVPNSMEELTKLAGVGRKTANVVLTNCFGIPGIVVDTHVLRVSNRLGFTTSSDPVEVEQDVGKVLPEGQWSDYSHRVTWFGREVCLARKPKCTTCKLNELCPYPEKI